MVNKRMVLGLVVVLVTACTVEGADKKGARKIDPQLANQLQTMFDRLDTDKDVNLSKAELTKGFGGGAMGFLQSYDEDKDGKISYAEFEEAGTDYQEAAKKTNDQSRQQNRNFGGRNRGGRGNYMQQYWRQWQEMMRKAQAGRG